MAYNGGEMRRRPLPTGTVTFLFTDIEGSTALWERDDAAMRTALAKHDAIVRRAVEAAGGTVFKTVGDASYCAFSRAEDAIAAAIAAQRSLGRAKWPPSIGELRVRMAITSAVARPRNGDYFGAALSRVARLLAIAHGEQILVGESAALLARESLPQDCDLEEIGAVRLRDLRFSEHLRQVVAPGLRCTFPPLDTGAPASSLPSRIAAFVGRSNDMRDIGDVVRDHRLTTLTGPGGIGKTRLALEAAHALEDTFSDGIFFISFAALERSSDVDALAGAAAAALAVRQRPGETLADALARTVGNRALLMIADNLEHILEPASALIRALAERCPNAHILTTSREALHLQGERVYRLAPLSLEEGADLFVSRAADRGFRAQADDPLVRDICMRLDGVPLAIELAAARAPTFGLRALREHLDEPLRLLVSKDQSEGDRHRTLVATIDWSHRLLEQRERALLAALSLFRSPFDAEAVVDVSRALELDALDAMDALDTLDDKSFVSSEARSDAWSILPIIRAFVEERTESDPRFQAVRDAFYSYVAERARRYREGAWPLDVWLERMEVLHENFEAVLRWGMENRSGDVSLTACDAAAFWQAKGLSSLAISWLTGIASSSTIPRDASFARVLRRLATFAIMADDYDQARARCAEASVIFGRCGDTVGQAEVEFTLGTLAQRIDDAGAKALYESALPVFRQARELRGIIACLNNLAQLADERGDREGARELLAEGQREAAAGGDHRSAAGILTMISSLEQRRGDLDAAARAIEQSIEIQKRLGVREDLPAAYAQLAHLQLEQGRFAESAEAAQSSLDEARRQGTPTHEAIAYQRLADVYARTQRETDAVDALRAAVRAKKHYDKFLAPDAIGSETLRLIEKALGPRATIEFSAEPSDVAPA
ncbi:MAG TPA: adenylate/guanylate cyclase domain-containing protein [Candidatus Baltobacteraceae bacterium]|jgi:predicted ATPase/class 3 adenylate cyclase/tetratricopeptide (TPR) repeat protein